MITEYPQTQPPPEKRPFDFIEMTDDTRADVSSAMHEIPIENRIVPALIAMYGTCSRDKWYEILLELDDYDANEGFQLGALVRKLREIRIIPCAYEHDRTGKVRSDDCPMQEANAGCGHQGLRIPSGSHRYAPGSTYTQSSIAVTENNAAASLEYAMAFLEGLGEDCSAERKRLADAAQLLFRWDREALNAPIESVPKLQEKQELYGQRIVELRNIILPRVMQKARAIQRGELPRTNKFWDEYNERYAEGL